MAARHISSSSAHQQTVDARAGDDMEKEAQRGGDDSACRDRRASATQRNTSDGLACSNAEGHDRVGAERETEASRGRTRVSGANGSSLGVIRGSEAELVARSLAPTTGNQSAGGSSDEQGGGREAGEGEVDRSGVQGEVKEGEREGLSEGEREKDVEGEREGEREGEGEQGVLPFEFQVMEVTLEAAMARLEEEGRALKQAAQSAMDDLTRAVTTVNLERVRAVKSRLTMLTSRVQKVRASH